MELKSKVGVFSKATSLFYSPPDVTTKEYVAIDFFCLLSVERWGFDTSSKVYLRFDVDELGSFVSCHGPMICIDRFAIKLVLNRA